MEEHLHWVSTRGQAWGCGVIQRERPAPTLGHCREHEDLDPLYGSVSGVWWSEPGPGAHLPATLTLPFSECVTLPWQPYRLHL